MESQTRTRRDLEAALIEKCWKHPEFKREVVKDPKGMLERHTGQKLPPEMEFSFTRKTQTRCIFRFRTRRPSSVSSRTNSWSGWPEGSFKDQQEIP